MNNRDYKPAEDEVWSVELTEVCENTVRCHHVHKGRVAREKGVDGVIAFGRHSLCSIEQAVFD